MDKHNNEIASVIGAETINPFKISSRIAEAVKTQLLITNTNDLRIDDIFERENEPLPNGRWSSTRSCRIGKFRSGPKIWPHNNKLVVMCKWAPTTEGPAT